MPKSLQQLNTQIAKLQRQAEAIHAKEVAGVVARIRKAIDHYGLSAADLGFSNGSGPAKAKSPPPRQPAKAARKRAAAGRRVGVIRFRDENGNSWTGHGKRPNWYKEALAAGKTPEDLAVKG